jgi:hypothetical protein
MLLLLLLLMMMTNEYRAMKMKVIQSAIEEHISIV